MTPHHGHSYQDISCYQPLLSESLDLTPPDPRSRAFATYICNSVWFGCLGTSSSVQKSWMSDGEDAQWRSAWHQSPFGRAAKGCVIDETHFAATRSLTSKEAALIICLQLDAHATIVEYLGSRGQTYLYLINHSTLFLYFCFILLPYIL